LFIQGWRGTMSGILGSGYRRELWCIRFGLKEGRQRIA
jgi:hypothetical protein